MFEARMTEGGRLKRILDSFKDLVNEANFECSATGISLQAMDSSHVALVFVKLTQECFELYRCDRSINLGMNMVNLGKLLKCANNDDIITMKAEDDNLDKCTFMFETKDQDRISDFELKLMDIDTEHMEVPDTKYDAIVRMPSSEYLRIVRDLTTIGDTVKMSVTKDAIRFSVEGDIGSANINVRSNMSAEKEEDRTQIKVFNPISLSFAGRYLVNFSKASALSSTVTLSISGEMPLLVQYDIMDKEKEAGSVSFYLAPKLDGEEN